MKNCPEWENGFDLLYQNITSNQAPGHNAYEKSVFLTEAEYAIVIGLYNGTLKHSFEETEELTSYLNSLVSQCECRKANCWLLKSRRPECIFRVIRWGSMPPRRKSPAVRR